MPNHVYHRIEIECDVVMQETVLKMIVNSQGFLDFNTLIPQPVSVYQGGLSSQHEEDFGENTWYTWNVKHWGTKWNCYQSNVTCNGNQIILEFQTAYGIPYPYVIALANTIMLPMKHTYLCEFAEWWGIETWIVCDDVAIRTSKSYNDKAQWREIAGLFWDDESLGEE